MKMGIYRDKYRSLNDTLWRPKRARKVKMVDLDSDIEDTPPAQGSSVPARASEDAVIPREVRLARAANLLDLPRFR